MKTKLPLPLLCFFVLPLFGLLIPSAALATPSQKDVFKSISDNVGTSSDESGGSAFLWIMAGVAVIVVLALFGRRQTLQATPKPVNNPNRLLREVLKTVPLKPREIRQIKTVADETMLSEDKPICSPLVLLLCPSILAKAADEDATRADRQTIRMIVKRLESTDPDVVKAVLSRTGI